MTIQTSNAQRTLKGQNDPEGRKRVARVLDYVLAHPRQTAHQVSEALDMDLRLVGYTLCNLARRGSLQTSGMVWRRMTYSGPAPVVEASPRSPRYKGAIGNKYVPEFKPSSGREFWLARDLALLARNP